MSDTVSDSCDLWLFSFFYFALEEPVLPSEKQQNQTQHELSVGTLVEVSTDVSDEPLYGVVRWLDNNTAGIELEDDNTHLPLDLTDGIHNGRRRFECAPGRALFVPADQCKPDARFADTDDHKPDRDNHADSSNLVDIGPSTSASSPPSKCDTSDGPISGAFGGIDSPVIPGAVPPLSMPTEEDVLAVCGKYRGIQVINIFVS